MSDTDGSPEVAIMTKIYFCSNRSFSLMLITHGKKTDKWHS